MRTLLLLSFCMLATESAYSQIVVTDNKNTLLNTALPIAGGLPIHNTRYIDLTSGSPFFQKEWAKSSLITHNGVLHNEIPTRIDLLENEVHYRDSMGTELVLGTPLREMEFVQAATGKKVHFVHGDLLPLQKKGYFQLLVNGFISLVERYVKTFQSHTSYGSATEYSITTEEKYFAYHNNREYEIKKLSDFTGILPSKKPEMESFLKTISKKLSRQEQFTAAATFANSLIH